jgi:hypothetical protein
MWTSFQTWFLQFDPAFRPMLIAAIGLIGPFVAAFVALAALKFTRWKHKRDAEMALRKDVYANASDTMAEAFYQLRQLPYPHSQLKDCNFARQKFAGSIGKILTVASISTQKSALAVQTRYNRVYRELAKMKRVVEADSAKVASLTGVIEHFADRQFHYRTQMEAATDPTAKAHFHEIFTGWTSGRSGNEQERGRLEKQGERNSLLMLQNLSSHLLDLTKLRIELLLAFREELGVKSDSKWMREAILASYAEAQGVRDAEIAKEKLRLHGAG